MVDYAALRADPSDLEAGGYDVEYLAYDWSLNEQRDSGS